MARKSTTSPTSTKMNRPGDISLNPSGNTFQVWTGNGWKGNYRTKGAAVDFMRTLHGPRLIPNFTKRTVKWKKSGGTISRKEGGKIMKGRKAGGTVKKQVGGGFDARLDESLAARHPAVRRNLAARRAESEGMERALGRGPYSGARTMAKKGGAVRRKKGSTVSRKRGGKIMQGYKAGGKV